MLKKRRYLFTDEPIPRRTEYRLRMRERVNAARQALQSSSESEEEREAQRPRRIPRPDGTVQTEPDRGLEEASSENDNELPETAITMQSGASSDGSSQRNVSENDETNSDGGTSSDNPLLSNYEEADGEQSDLNVSVVDSVSGSEDTGTESEPEELLEEVLQAEIDAGEPVQEREDRHREPELATPLCPCTSTTEGDVLLMCLALGMRHNLSWVAIVDILKMMNVCMDSDIISASKYFLFKYMEVGKDDTTFHLYCPSCESYLGERGNIGNEGLRECECEELPDLDSLSTFYISVNVKGQIERLLQNPSIANEILTYRFQRKKNSDEAFEDIYDGQAYKKLSQEGGILSNPLNFSYVFNTDGVNLTNSSAMSAWPIFLQINELSPLNRKKHMILAGMWVGKKDPNMRLFLKTFASNANNLSSEGVHWVNAEGVNQVSKVIPTCLVADSGARYKLLNCSSFHSYYGCTFCYQKAENTREGRRFTLPQNRAQLRTHESMLLDMRSAHENRNHRDRKMRVVRGCKGPTPLMTMVHFDLSVGLVVDYMHSALLGNARSHFASLLHSVGSLYYIGDPDTIYKIGVRLESIKPPHVITRTPRSLKDVKNWKANEWRGMLLFYCLVCLQGYLRKEYLSHLALLSAAFNILLQKSSTLDELHTAHQYLMRYVYLTQQYFGERGMYYNVHLLQHLVKSVIDWGPLWAHSTFTFEGTNHNITQMYSSPGQVAHQLTRRYLTYNALPTLCEKYASSESSLDFIQDLTGKKLKNFLRCGDTVLPGKGTSYELRNAERNALLAAQIEAIQGNLKEFPRLMSKGMRICTHDYAQGKQYNDAYVALKSGTRCVVKTILQIDSGNDLQVILLLRKLVLSKTPIFQSTDVSITHIHKVRNEGALLAVKPTSIERQCILMNLDEVGTFIADIPYGCTIDD